MPPVDSARPFEVAAIAVVVFAVLILIGRVFGLIIRRVSRWLGRYVPVRVSRVIGIAVALVLFVMIGNGVLMTGFLRSADTSFAALDALIEPQYAQPEDPLGDRQRRLAGELEGPRPGRARVHLLRADASRRSRASSAARPSARSGSTSG